MEEEFLRKYYSVGKTTSVRKAFHEFTQRPISAFFSISNALFPSSSMMKSLSLQRRVVNGLENFAKS